MTPHRILSAGLIVVSCALAGCPPATCPERFVSLRTLVDEHNANAAQVRRLWARVRIRVTLADESGQSRSWGSASPLAKGNGRMMLVRRDDGRLDFLIVGDELGTELFRVGTDSAEGLYYFWYSVGDASCAWFGRTEYAGAPGVQSVPIDPTQLPEVLGVLPLPPVQPGIMPTVVMTLQNDPAGKVPGGPGCAYVVRYLKPQPVTGNLKIWREVYFRWDHRLPRLPYHVRLYDADGLCRVMADVSKYQPIQTAGPPDAWPIMPTDIRITWPAIPKVQTASSLHMLLTEMTRENPFIDRVFGFWRHLPPSLRELRQVDAVYGAVEPPEPSDE